MSTQRDRFEGFRASHAPGQMLILPNAWDAASARMAEALGAKAIATSSAALAWCHGYADGDVLPTPIALSAVGEILRVVSTPVTVDSEGGYSADPGAVAAHVCQLIGLGAAGVNREDGHSPPDLLAAKIRAIKEAAKARDADIFINARCEVYLHDLAANDRKLRSRFGAAGFTQKPALTDCSSRR